MSISIVDYTENKIKELEEIKSNAKFYQENECLLTTHVEDLLASLDIYPIVLPNKFIMALHGIEATRNMYVFDVLDIRDTKGRYPELMDEGSYKEFVEVVNSGIKEYGLSVDMKMTQDQRMYFDRLVRTREESFHTLIPSYDTWYEIICNIIFSPVPDEAKPVLREKYANLLVRVTQYVMEKCGRKRLSNDEIKDYINEVLELESLRIFDLREVNWQEVELDKKRRRR